MSLILAGLVFAGTSGALWVGRWLVTRRGLEAGAKNEPEHEKTEDEDDKRANAEVEHEAPTRKDADGTDANEGEPDKKPGQPAKRSKRKGKPPAGETTRLDGFVCQLGDVLMRHTGEEAWLAGGVVLSEDMPVAVLFVAPDAGQDCVIYVRTRPKGSLFWLEALDPSAVLVGGEPPSSVEHASIRFDRVRRLPLRPRRIGVGAPDVGDAVVVAEYASAGAERLLVVKASNGVVRAYRGLELEAGSFEVIASGDSTLEP